MVLELESVLRGAHACLATPCEECRLVEPRLAFPACPHGDLDRTLDFVMVGLNPELPGYATECRSCGDAATFRAFVDAGKRCPRCGGEEIEFRIPPDYQDWRRDGADGDVRGFANRRVDLTRLEGRLGRPVNFANARYSPWPSVNDKTISFGSKVGGHLLDFIEAVQPRAILVYSSIPWAFLRRTLVPNVRASRRTFVTSGGRKHWGESFSATPARRNQSSWVLSGIAISQAQDANYAAARGLTRREWVADALTDAIGTASTARSS